MISTIKLTLAEESIQDVLAARWTEDNLKPTTVHNHHPDSPISFAP